MSWLAAKIKTLQEKPYEARVKILKRVIVLSVILIVGVWLLTLRLREGRTPAKPSPFSPLLNNIKKLKDLKPAR